MAYRRPADEYGPNDVFALLGTLGKLETQDRQNRLDRDTSTSLDLQGKDPNAQRPDGVDATAWENAQTIRAQRQQAQNTALAGQQTVKSQELDLFDKQVDRAGALASQVLGAKDTDQKYQLLRQAGNFMPDGWTHLDPIPVATMDDAGKQRAKQDFGDKFDGTGFIVGGENTLDGQRHLQYVPGKEVGSFLDEQAQKLVTMADEKNRYNLRRGIDAKLIDANMKQASAGTPRVEIIDGQPMVTGFQYQQLGLSEDGQGFTPKTQFQPLDSPVPSDQLPDVQKAYLGAVKAKYDVDKSRLDIDLTRQKMGTEALNQGYIRAHIGLVNEQTNATRALADQRDAKTQGLGQSGALGGVTGGFKPERIKAADSLAKELATSTDEYGEKTVDNDLRDTLYSQWNDYQNLIGGTGQASDPIIMQNMKRTYGGAYDSAIGAGLSPDLAKQHARMTLGQTVRQGFRADAGRQDDQTGSDTSGTLPEIQAPRLSLGNGGAMAGMAQSQMPRTRETPQAPQQRQDAASAPAPAKDVYAEPLTQWKTTGDVAQGLGQVAALPLRVVQAPAVWAGSAISKLRDFASSRYPGVKMSTPEGAALYMRQHPEDAEKFFQANPDVAASIREMAQNSMDRR